MNLLPKSHSEFHSPEYWDDFFKKRGTKAFEWYGEYPELCGILHKYIKPKDKLLVVGCGNSQLSENLYDVGHHNISNIDISDTVIRQMNEKNKNSRPELKFLKMDVMQMDFTDGEFSAVLDKGTLDALMVDSSESVVADIERMFTEVGRVLRQGGRYICISLLQEHILDKVLSFFPDLGWPIRIHRVVTENSDNSDKEFHMPVFALVFTKFKKLPNMKQILEVVSAEEKVERFDSIDQIRKVLKEMQYYALIRQQIGKRNVAGEQVSLSLYSELSSVPRYTLYIVDSTEKNVNKFAIFIVPEGRETEWTFSSEEGRLQLSQSAGFGRLVVVTLHRDQTYTDLESIKSELSHYVMELAPPGFKPGVQVPFLSLGDDKGQRTVQHRGTSEMTGDYVIEDVEGVAGQVYRRLVFLSAQNVVQSEARLKHENVKKKKKKGKLVIDKTYLACQHHIAMVTGIGFVKHCGSDTAESCDLTSGMRVLVVGLGGGGLPTFIHANFPEIHVDVVDIDPMIVKIAKEWFGFIEDESLNVHVADGIQYIQDLVKAEQQVDVIMLDVDSKDTTVGMSCPPDSFVTVEFLGTIKKALPKHGVFVLNLVCRDTQLKKTVISKVSSVFAAIYSVDIADEINQIIFALPEQRESDKDNMAIATANVTALNSLLKRNIGSSSNEVDLCDMFKILTIVDR